MSTCTRKSFCASIRTKLVELGASKSEIEVDCTGPWPCYATFENAKLLMKYVNPDNSDGVTSFIKRFFGGRLPIDDSPFAIRSVKKDDPFRCAILNIDIYQPCAVSTCAFYTDVVWTKNCIIHYAAEHQRKQGLAVKDLSFLLGEPSLALRSKSKAVLTQLGNIAVKLEADQQDEQVAMREDGCSACGQEMEYVRKTKYGFMYCSDECYANRPPIDLQIEREFHLSVDKVLRIGVGSFASIKAIGGALGINPRQFRDLCHRHHIDIANLD